MDEKDRKAWIVRKAKALYKEASQDRGYVRYMSLLFALEEAFDEGYETGITEGRDATGNSKL